jgi:hypothetical protein
MADFPNLAAALAAFQAEMPTVTKGKTATVPTKAGGQYTYTYADLADVTQTAMPLLARHGLSFSSQPRRTEQGDYELVGVLLHTSGDRESGSLPLFGRTAQEIGSSLTYGRRYLLGCMTGIVTDDDDDAATASGTSERARRGPTPEETQAARFNAAKAAVKDAWASTHGGEFDLGAVREDYEQHTALPMGDATADDLSRYAAHLRGATS